ncbi:MAG: hypothetical protein GC159_10660 [Phycisphaera sp.]|nr:hypothetical protein [Phycisphaera sp.]
MKQAECESCAQVYHYKVERTASGRAFSPAFIDNKGASDRASRAAERALKKKLDNALDPVACPYCGHYQKNMVRQSKWRRFGWTFGLMMLAATFLFIISMNLSRHHSAPFRTAAIVTGVAGLVMGVVWFIVHNPNRGHGEKGARRDNAEETSNAKYRSEDRVRADMHRALRNVMLMTAAADGVVDDVEIECIARLVKVITESSPDPAVLRTEADAFVGGGAQRHTQIHAQLGDLSPYLDDEGKTLFIKASLIVATADGPANETERDVLAKIGASLNMTVSQIDLVIDHVSETAVS